MRSSKYDAATLAPIVASSHSLSDVLRQLGLTPNGGNHRMISMLVRRHGLDTSHFSWGGLRRAVQALSIESLTLLIQESTSFAEVLRKVGLPTEGRAHRELTRHVATLGIDTSHFTGSGWSRGLTASTHPIVAHVTRSQTRPDEQVFVENSPQIRGEALRRRLLAKGWSYACAMCGISDWCAKPLTLEIDHINGVNNDNRLANLRFLCPNCHSQTETYCRRIRPMSSRASERTVPYSCYTSPRTRACWNW